MTNLWYEITATTPPEMVEVVAAIMRDIVPGGVTVEEPLDLLGIDEGFRLREGDPYKIRAYLPASELGAVLTDDLRNVLEPYSEVELTARPFQEQDWSESWREFFGAVDTGGRIAIVPSWVEHEVRPGQLVIKLDPGRAFGTGHHETTRLCIAGLESAIQSGCSVLDVGTGSGILSIAAVLLGAGPVTALDVDPVCIDIARANVRENGLDGRIDFRHGVLDEAHDRRYDVVVANINRDANMALAPVFGTVVKPGGSLLLSGFLGEDSPRVTECMVRSGFAFAEARHERDWCMLGFQRSDI